MLLTTCFHEKQIPNFHDFFLPFTMFDEIKSKHNLLKKRLKFGIRFSYFVKPCGGQLKREGAEREKRKKNNRKPLLLSAPVYVYVTRAASVVSTGSLSTSNLL